MLNFRASMFALCVIATSCSDGGEDPETVAFTRVTLEEGGKCLANGDGCSRSWAASADGTFVYETRDGSETATLTTEEQTALQDLVSDPRLVRALRREEVTCQRSIADFGVTITLSLPDREYRDPEAAGCAVDPADHPYAKLRTWLQQTAVAHFHTGGR